MGQKLSFYVLKTTSIFSIDIGGSRIFKGGVKHFFSFSSGRGGATPKLQ